MIEVLRPGFLSTVQDLGRHGFTHLGVSPAGAADPVYLRLGNMLLGNPESAAAIELTLGGGLFRVHADTQIVVAGEMEAKLENVPLKPFFSKRVASGQLVSILPAENALRTYLCVAGGIDVPPVLGSRSTHRPSNLGGIEGRQLRTGDRLKIGEPTANVPERELPALVQDLTVRRTRLRVTPGPHLASFRKSAIDELSQCRCRVEPDSNRMGVRLSGSPIRALADGILSEGVPLGALQVTPSGEMILLGVDAQTTGGYPVIAVVIAADIPSMGQLCPGATVEFEVVDYETARNLLMNQEKLIYECKEWLAG